MAFSLKKWIGSMLFSSFMNEYNENMEAIEDKFGEVEGDIDLFEAHMADYATEIANRVKKDGDTTSKYLCINSFYTGLCFLSTGAATQAKIKTKIIQSQPLFFEIKYGGLGKGQVIYLTFEPNASGINYAKAKSIGINPPVITIAKEDGYVVIHIAIGADGRYSGLSVNAMGRMSTDIADPKNWTIVDEAILANATNVTVVPYVD